MLRRQVCEAAGYVEEAGCVEEAGVCRGDRCVLRRQVCVEEAGCVGEAGVC